MVHRRPADSANRRNAYRLPHLTSARGSEAQIVLTDVVITKVVVSGDRQVDFSLGYARIAWRFLRDGKVVSESQFDLRTNTG